MRKERNREEQGSAHEAAGMMRWLLTYADMITLLLAFFIVLYALSQVNQQKYESLMQALKAVMHGKQVSQIKVKSATPPPYPPPSKVKSNPQKYMPVPERKLLAKIQKVVAKDKLQSSVKVSVIGQGIEVMFMNDVLFQVGQASLTVRAQGILRDIAGPLRGTANAVAIQGYTDDLPIHTAQFPSNWDLSAARAARVVDFWTGIGLNPHRFLIEGFGQYSPFAPNATASGRERNRRADAIILNDHVLGPTKSVLLGKSARSPPRPIAGRARSAP